MPEFSSISQYDSDGDLQVKVNGTTLVTEHQSAYTSFGEKRIAAMTPAAGWKFTNFICSDMVTTLPTGNGTIYHDMNKVILSTGSGTTASTAEVYTNRELVYIPGIGVAGRVTFTFHGTPQTGDYQVVCFGRFSGHCVFVGYNGTVFGNGIRDNGTIKNFAAQTAWTSDTFSELNLANGNVYEEKIQWLGFGALKLSIEKQENGLLMEANIIPYANSSPVTSLENASIPLSVYVSSNTGNTLTIKSSSGMLFYEGNPGYPQPINPMAFHRPFSNGKTGVQSEVPMLSIQIPATFQGSASHIFGRLIEITGSSDGTRAVTYRLVLNGTLTNSSFSDYDATRSSLKYDVAATAIAGGRELDKFQVGKVATIQRDLMARGLQLLPGQTITVTAQSAASATADVNVDIMEIF